MGLKNLQVLPQMRQLLDKPCMLSPHVAFLVKTKLNMPVSTAVVRVDLSLW